MNHDDVQKNSKGTPATPRRVMKEFSLSEISLVDSPAQAPARVAILKRNGEDDAQKRMAITTMTAGHAHSILTSNHLGGENRMGQTSYVDGHAHDWVMDEAGAIFIADAMGHNHGIAVLTKSNDGAPATVGGIQPAGVDDAAKSGAENTSMTPEQLAALQKAADEGKAKIAELEKANARSQSILKLAPEQRAHFDTLKAEDQDAFLASTPEQREQVVKNLRDANPVIFTALDGTEYRKSDDARLVKMARDRDEDRKALLREQSIRKQAELEKRAGEELANLGGEITTKAALLGAVDSIQDQAVRAKVLEVLKQQDAGLGKAFTRVGTSAAPNVEKKAGERLDDLAKAYSVANKCALDKAYDAVVQTPEGRELYEAHRAGR
jgi:hypothetical protein